jgi:hypothetical protein
VRIKRVPVVTLLALLMSGCATKSVNSADRRRAASIMLDRFETVFYANVGFLSGGGDTTVYRRRTKTSFLCRLSIC